MWKAATRAYSSVYRTYGETAASLAKPATAADIAASPAMAAYGPVLLAHEIHAPESSGNTTSASATPPILFLHGLFGARANNRSVARALAKRLNTSVHCLDLRNHGDSPHAEPHSYPAMAADVEAYIDNNTSAFATAPIVLGHSMGAKVAMAVALRGKTAVSGVVSVDNAPVVGAPTTKFTQYVAALQRAEHDGCKSLRECDKHLQQVEDNKAIRGFLLTNMRRDPVSGLYRSRVPLATLSAAIRAGDISGWPFAALPVTFPGPLLVVRGTQSAYVPDEALPAVGLYFARFAVADVDAGHWLTAEAPEAFVDAVGDWADKIDWQYECV